MRASKRKTVVGANHMKGFTIVEMMITLAIIAIAAGIATPNVLLWVANARLDGAARNVLFNFQSAKMEAAKRSTYCTVTFNQPVGGTTYDYVVYIDADRDLEYDSGEKIVKQTDFSGVSEYKGVSFDTSQGGGDGLTFTDNDDSRPSVAFNSRGLTMNNAGGSGAGNVYLKNEKGRTKRIQVSTAGSIRIAD